MIPFKYKDPKDCRVGAGNVEIDFICSRDMLRATPMHFFLCVSISTIFEKHSRFG